MRSKKIIKDSVIKISFRSKVPEKVGADLIQNMSMGLEWYVQPIIVVEKLSAVILKKEDYTSRKGRSIVDLAFYNRGSFCLIASISLKYLIHA